ncbi:MAG: hypothetical protein HW380_1945 [Magnetococcales bacterium]|nr:hypothetical protein [Magnetococcales bacterium]HIJ85557.1 hypothetical protein [Magnetococcales bacterium]
MWTDPIVEEVRKNREEFAARFNFDLRAMGKALQEREKISGRRMISLASEGLGGTNEISKEFSVCVSEK